MLVSAKPEVARSKPFALLASIASYIATYRDTKTKDAARAHDLRKHGMSPACSSTRRCDAAVHVGHQREREGVASEQAMKRTEPRYDRDVHSSRR